MLIEPRGSKSRAPRAVDDASHVAQTKSILIARWRNMVFVAQTEAIQRGSNREATGRP